MNQKDLTEKNLESYNDVFADIVNGLLFEGKQVVHENDLAAASPVSQYKLSSELHSQERDVAKFWKNGSIRLCLFGIENQTKIDKWMPVRVLSYDAANYRIQLSNKKDNGKLYPTVTLVLSFGEERWKAKNLRDCLEIPSDLEDYVSDYGIKVFEIPWLTPEQVELFKSDFKIVADYFVQRRMKKDYTPSKDTILHVEEIMNLMSTLTGDKMYENFLSENYSKQNGDKNMDTFLRDYYKRGVDSGISQGMSKGAHQTAEKLLTMDVISTEQIAEATGLSMQEVLEIKSRLQNKATTIA